MKLHLGCDTKYIKDWTNLDIDAEKADIHDDAKTLKKIRNNSCNLIYASHLLEHFGRREVKSVLEVWYKKLKPGGVLRLSVPDFAKVTVMYHKGYPMDKLLGFLVGGQRDKYDFHAMIFDRKSLTRLLKEIGFKKIRNWDWRKTEHNHIDDYSQAYLPHMDKEQGVMMSLNIEALK